MASVRHCEPHYRKKFTAAIVPISLLASVHSWPAHRAKTSARVKALVQTHFLYDNKYKSPMKGRWYI